jgi:hypothetical protein
MAYWIARFGPIDEVDAALRAASKRELGAAALPACHLRVLRVSVVNILGPLPTLPRCAGEGVHL